MLLGIAWLLVLVLVVVISQPGLWWALLVAAPLSRVPFEFVFYLFFYHVRRVILLIKLVWLILGQLHKVHLCIVLHRWVMFLGLRILLSHVCT